jgi:hypothetical protein
MGKTLQKGASHDSAEVERAVVASLVWLLGQEHEH